MFDFVGEIRESKRERVREREEGQRKRGGNITQSTVPQTHIVRIAHINMGVRRGGNSP